MKTTRKRYSADLKAKVEPGRRVGDAEQAMNFTGAHALFAGAKQVITKQPLVQRHLGTLEHGAYGAYGAYGDGELFATSFALDKAGAALLAF